MKILGLAILMFLMEFVGSYTANMSNTSIVSRRVMKSVLYGSVATSISLLNGWFLFVQERIFLLAVPILLGNAAGDALAAARKLKKQTEAEAAKKAARKKTPYRRKVPVTTA